MAVEAAAGVATGTAFNPLLLGTTLGFGVYNAFNTWGQAKQAQAEAEKRIKRLDALMSKNRQEQADVTQQATADSVDMRANYVTARDPNKAQGLAQMYQSGMNNFRNTIAGLKQAHTSLEAQREEINAPTNAEAAGQVGAGLAGTALSMYGSYKAGQAADMAQHNQNEFTKSLMNPTYEYKPYVQPTFGEEVSAGLKSMSDWFKPSAKAQQVSSTSSKFTPTTKDVYNKWIDPLRFNNNKLKSIDDKLHYDESLLNSNTGSWWG